MTCYPSILEIQRSLSEPRKHFVPSELSQSEPVRDHWGRARIAMGGSALVSQFRTPTGSRLAVRVPLRRPSPTARRRWSVIARTLRDRIDLGLIVPRLLPDALVVGDVSVDIFLARWCEGKALLEAVRAHRLDGSRLQRWAQGIRGRVTQLTAAGLAHGDLSHSNILVSGDVIELIDLESMFVPGLAGEKRAVLGHPHCLHRESRLAIFDNTIDRFPAWVLILSLEILAEDPSVDQLVADPDALLFTEDDLRNPEGSEIFRRLESHPRSSIRQRAKRLHALACGPIAAVPPLDALMQREPGPDWLIARIHQLQGVSP